MVPNTVSLTVCKVQKAVTASIKCQLYRNFNHDTENLPINAQEFLFGEALQVLGHFLWLQFTATEITEEDLCLGQFPIVL